MTPRRSRTAACLLTCFAAVGLFATVTSVSAQTRPARPPRLDLAVGSGIVGGAGLGQSNADLRGRSGEPVGLFETSSRVAMSVPLEVRVGYEPSPRYGLEMRAGYTRPELRTDITGDVEGAPALTAIERVHQYVLDGGIVVPLTRARARAAGPFLSAGAGYGWIVHEGLALLEHGVTFRGGGGARYPLVTRNRGFIRGLGIRGDAAFVVMTGGAALGDGASRHLTATASVYVRF